MNAIRPLEELIFAYEPIVKTVTGSQLVFLIIINIYIMNRRLSTGDAANIYTHTSF